MAAPPVKSSYSWLAMLVGILAESYCVVSDHSRHFIALSALFLIPISSLLISSPSLLPLLLHPHPHPPSPPPRSLLRSSSPSPSFLDLIQSLTLATAAALFLSLSAAAAAASVIRSVKHGLYGLPVKLLDNLCSLYLPVLCFLATFLSSLLIFSAIVYLCLLLLFVLSLLDVDSGSVPPYRFAVVVAAAITAVTIARLQLEWCLSGVVAVLESSWGFAPLKRSGELLEGMWPAAIFLWVFFGTGIGLTLWGFGLWDITGGWSWYEVMPVVLKTVFGSALTAVLLLYLLVTHAALYLYCKAVHLELPEEIVEELGLEYVTLPFDENRVPHVVSVILR